MARAFIASVPLAIVVVAALVVPLLVIPGTFGFERWPTSPPNAVTDRNVRPETIAPAPVTVEVQKRPRRAPAAHRTATRRNESALARTANGGHPSGARS